MPRFCLRNKPYEKKALTARRKVQTPAKKVEVGNSIAIITLNAKFPYRMKMSLTESRTQPKMERISKGKGKGEKKVTHTLIQNEARVIDSNMKSIHNVQRNKPNQNFITVKFVSLHGENIL